MIIDNNYDIIQIKFLTNINTNTDTEAKYNQY